MADDVLPFLTADPEYVLLGPWAWHHDNVSEPLPSFLPDWDYLTDISISRSVTIDLTDILEGVGLAEVNPRLGWSVSWRATDSKLTGSAGVVEIVATEHDLRADIPGADLGASLDVHTRLVLLDDVKRQPGVASEAGSVLFSETHRVDLIGSLAQFPIAVIDFAAAGLDDAASVVVDIDPDPTSPVLAGLQLLLNEHDSQLVEASRRGNPTTQPHKALLEQLDEAVFLRLVDYAVDNGDALAEQEWDADSIGMVCMTLADQLGGITDLSEMRRQNHSRYQATVAGAARRRGMGRQL